MSAYGFEQLDVWKKACALAVKIYSLLKDSSDYGLRNQMQKAASNIAEGAERRSQAQFSCFLLYAKGSAAELRTQLSIASQVKFISEEDCFACTQDLLEISRMLEGLRKAITQKKDRCNQF